MDAAFYRENRRRMYEAMDPDSLLLVFSGEQVRRSSDEFYPFSVDRNFLYLTGLDCPEAVLFARKGEKGVEERLYLLPPDPMAERWTGKRVTPGEAWEISGVEDTRSSGDFQKDVHGCLGRNEVREVYLDLFKTDLRDPDRCAHRFLDVCRRAYPYLKTGNADRILRRLRLIKMPCEIDAIRRAEEITREGILAMMRMSAPGTWEYQYRAEFNRVLGQYGPAGPGFPSIISAGRNNFCIHYYACSGRAEDGDMVLNDVGAQWDYHTTDVSRGWPCSGRFSPRQKLLFECALKTSDHMFGIIRPGMPMKDVDRLARAYNARMLVEAGVMKHEEDVGTYMWHGGAHHIGYDVHDLVETPERIAPGMVFCVDIGIYHEEWGIGFRLEDNCLVTEEGCENLSAGIPRTVEDIEAVMN